jgi:hypothetical protein
MDSKSVTSKKSLQASLAPLVTNARGDEQVAREAANQASAAADSKFFNAQAAAVSARSAAADAADAARREAVQNAAAARNAKANS